MSTHALTFVHEGGINSRVLVCIFRHHDGYPNGHGGQLENILKQIILEDRFVADDMELLSAKLVTQMFLNHNTAEEDDIKLMSVDSGNTEQYNYHVYLDSSNKLALKYTNAYDRIWTNILLYTVPSEPEYTKIAEFVYKSAYYDAVWKWRKIGFLKIEDGYLQGYDLDDENKFKKFNMNSVLDGEIKYYTK